MIKCVIFDFDGTLVDSTDLLGTITNELTEKYKMNKLSGEELNQLKKLPVKKRLKKLNVPFYKLPRITVDILVKYNQYAGTLKISEEIKTMLAELKRAGLKLVVLSSNSTGNIEKCLKANGIEGVDKIYSTNGLLDKRTMINKCIRESKLEKEEVIYVGDELRDVEACKKAEIRIIAVKWGYDSVELLERGCPDYFALEPSEILGIIKNG